MLASHSPSCTWWPAMLPLRALFGGQAPFTGRVGAFAGNDAIRAKCRRMLPPDEIHRQRRVWTYDSGTRIDSNRLWSDPGRSHPRLYWTGDARRSDRSFGRPPPGWKILADRDHRLWRHTVGRAAGAADRTSSVEVDRYLVYLSWPVVFHQRVSCVRSLVHHIVAASHRRHGA